MVVAGYYAAAHLGFAFQFTGPIASMVWLPVGVGIAGLYLFGLGVWPAVLAGDLLVNNYSALPLGSAIGQSIGNLIEVTLAAYLMRRFARRHPPLETIGGFERMLVAITAGTIVSATVGSAALYLGDAVGLSSLGHLWRTWWLGDFCGAMIVVPLAIAWLPPPARPWFRGHLLEVSLLLATLVVVSTIAVQVDHSLSYLGLVVLIWAGLRFGARGTTLAIVIGAGFTIWGTTHVSGAFAFPSLSRSVVDTQLYLAVAAITALSVVTLARERERLAESVRDSRMRVVVAADNERRRLERDLHDGAQQRSPGTLGAPRPWPHGSWTTARPRPAPRCAGRRWSWRSQSTSCATWSMASIRRRCGGSASRGRSRWRRPARTRRSRCSHSPSADSTRSRKPPPTSSFSRRSPTPSATPERR